MLTIRQIRSSAWIEYLKKGFDIPTQAYGSRTF
jgi:hypothetical protein